MIEVSNVSRKERKLVKKIYKTTLSHFSQKDIFKVEICFISTEDMKSLNLEKREINKVTDVLSFPFVQLGKLPVEKNEFAISDCDNRGRVLLGSIAICREVAKMQAVEYEHSIEREIAFLTVHGLLHLLGFDHEEGRAQESEMFKIQEKVLGNCKLSR